MALMTTWLLLIWRMIYFLSLWPYFSANGNQPCVATHTLKHCPWFIEICIWRYGIGVLLRKVNWYISFTEMAPRRVATKHLWSRAILVYYNDVIMSARASQITSVSIVCSTVYLGAVHGKHQSSASLTFVRGIHRWPCYKEKACPFVKHI